MINANSASIEANGQATLPGSVNAVPLPALDCVALFLDGGLVMPGDKQGRWRFGHTDRQGRTAYVEPSPAMALGEAFLYGVPGSQDCKKWWVEALGENQAWQRITPQFDAESAPLYGEGMPRAQYDPVRAERLQPIRWAASGDFYRAKIWCTDKAGKLFQQWFITPFCEAVVDWDQVPATESASFVVTKIDSAGTALGSVLLAPGKEGLRLNPPLSVKLSALQAAAGIVTAGLALLPEHISIPACPDSDASLLCLIRDAASGQILAAEQKSLEEAGSIPWPAAASKPYLQVKLTVEGGGASLALFDGDWLLWSTLPEQVGLPASEWVFPHLEGGLAAAKHISVEGPGGESLLPISRALKNTNLPLPSAWVDKGEVTLRFYEGNPLTEKGYERITPFQVFSRPLTVDSKVIEKELRTLLIGIVANDETNGDLNQYIVRWTCASHWGIGDPPVIAPSFTALANIAAEQEKKWLWASMAGHLISKKYWLRQGLVALLESPSIAFAHILFNRGVLTLHEQSLLLNIDRWKQIGCPDIDGPATLEIPVPSADISSINAHDHYTPAYVQSSESGVACKAQGLGAVLIARALANDERITNFPFFIRRNKRFLYPDQNPKTCLHLCKTYDEEGGKALEEPRLKELREECHGFGEPGIDMTINWLNDLDEINKYIESLFYGWNTEPFEITPQKITNPNYIMGVAAGLKLEYLGYVAGITPTTKVVYVDVSKNTLDWKRILLEEWDGTDYLEFSKNNAHRVLGRAFYPDEIADVIGCYNSLLDKIGDIDKWIEFWGQYRKLSFQFVHNDFIENLLSILNNVEPNKTGLVWISNIFHYHLSFFYSRPELLGQKKKNFIGEFVKHFASFEMFGSRPKPIAYSYKDVV